MATDIELAYAAGIIDGEGTICIVKVSGKWVRSKIGYDYYTHVAVGMTCKELCDWLQIQFGGHINHQTRSKQFPTCKDVWVWQLRRSHVLPFLKAVEPYLKVKKLQAQNAIQYQESITEGRTKVLTEAEHILRDNSYQKAKSLNGLGKS